MESVLYDAAGHRRSPATMPGYHVGRPPRNKGVHYPADPPTIEEIVAVMRAAGNGPAGARLGALIVILWRARANRVGPAPSSGCSLAGESGCLCAAGGRPTSGW
jgi:hypothetical protein